jgi:hypothetical protein
LWCWFWLRKAKNLNEISVFEMFTQQPAHGGTVAPSCVSLDLSSHFPYTVAPGCTGLRHSVYIGV